MFIFWPVEGMRLYAASEVEALQAEAKRAGIQPLVMSERPIGT